MGGLSTVSLSELLRGFRARARLTQAALAEEAGLSEQAISVLERGTRSRPRMDTIRSLTAALGLDADEAEQFLAVARGKRHEPRSHAPEAEIPVASDALPVPWQLPPAVPDFTGRAAQVEAILSVLRAPAGLRSDAVGLVTVTGMGGIGKTALAVQAAHRLADSYPDGHLYLNLRGYGPGQPMSAADALRQLLRSLGVDTQLIPEAVEEAAALLRSQLAGRRMLMLLDNAADGRQVMPLLPGSPGSAAIITSRGSLAALPGARQIRLDALSESESIELLSGVIGRSRVAAEPDAAEMLASFTGRLPLAVRLIGGRLAARPAWPIQHLVDLLHDEERRLDSLGSDETGVRASIASSVRFLESSDRDLDREAARALPLLSIPDGADLLTVVAAHLLDVPVRRADAILERLVDLNLLESVAPEHYRFHDLIRAYARELADRALTPPVRDAGLERILRFYTGFAWACQSLTHEASPRLRLATIHIKPIAALADTVPALAWLDDEQRNVMDRFRQASVSSLVRSDLLPELTLALFGYHESRSRWHEMRDLSAGMVELAEQRGLAAVAAWLEHDRAIPEAENGDLDIALAHLANALQRFRRLSDLTGQARCCTSLGHVLEQLGRLDEALDFTRQALALSLQIGDATIEGVSFVALGVLHNRLGQLAEAEDAFAQSIRLAEDSGDHRSLAKRYLNIAKSHVATGQIERALPSVFSSIEVAERSGNSNAESEARELAAVVYARLGEFATAAQHARSSLQLTRTVRNRLREGRVLFQLGRIMALEGKHTEAIDVLSQATEVLRDASPKIQREAVELIGQIQRAEAITFGPTLF